MDAQGWWDTLDDVGRAEAIAAWQTSRFEELNDMVPAEHRHDGTEAWVHFGYADWDTGVVSEVGPTWGIDDDLSSFLDARHREAVMPNVPHDPLPVDPPA
jgi:hypothetical protein